MKRLLAECVRGLQRNLKPGLVLWTIALAVLAAYYLVPALRPGFEEIAALKNRWGYLYSAVSTAVFGGLLPFGILILLGRVNRAHLVSHGLFFVLFWVYKGLEVDVLYRLQDAWFGTANDLPTVLCKVFVDQFVYNSLWSAPMSVLAYRWKDAEFSFSRLLRGIDRHLVTFTFPVALVSTWLVWIPTVMAVYALPEPLRIPLFNIVLCFWVLLLAWITDGEES